MASGDVQDTSVEKISDLELPATSSVPRSLNALDFVVKNAPPTICYIPNFIDTDFEDILINHVNDAPKPKWEFLKNRRLQNWGGIVGKKSLIADNSMPDWLNIVIDRIMEVENTFPESNRPNHVLVNEYLPGQGIMPHTDGPAFFPTVCTVSLGSHTLLDLFEPWDEKNPKAFPERYVGSMLLQPRSLILIRGEAYESHLHGIADRTADEITEKIFNRPAKLTPGIGLERGTRISLTIRNVPNVNTKLMNSLFGRK
uniref:Fe2OG dioxygenase domain-containing protein n=1 Tax=Panagrellus redivivus TaxID=6233 RepID=A0A7E4V9M9_PANRE